MTNALWARLAHETQAEVDRLVGVERNVQAMVLVRERVGEPTPGIRECGDLVAFRIAALQRSKSERATDE